MIRSLRPLDVIGLVALNTADVPNQAMPWEQMGRRPAPGIAPSVLTSTLLPSPRRQTWVSSHGLRLQGIASARKGAAPAVWELDTLLLTPGAERSCPELLEGLSVSAGQSGGERLFLRVAVGSPAQALAAEAGFTAYLKETLLRLEKGHAVISIPAPEGVRPCTSGDEPGIFQLYCAASPVAVRCFEGMTLREWQDFRGPVARSRRCRSFVYTQGDAVLGFLGIGQSGAGALLDLMLHPQAQGRLEGLLDYGLSLLPEKRRILALVPHFDPFLEGLLTRRGFVAYQEYVAQMKLLAVRLKEPCLAPAGI